MCGLAFARHVGYVPGYQRTTHRRTTTRPRAHPSRTSGQQTQPVLWHECWMTLQSCVPAPFGPTQRKAAHTCLRASACASGAHGPPLPRLPPWSPSLSGSVWFVHRGPLPVGVPYHTHRVLVVYSAPGAAQNESGDMNERPLWHPGFTLSKLVSAICCSLCGDLP